MDRHRPGGDHDDESISILRERLLVRSVPELLDIGEELGLSEGRNSSICATVIVAWRAVPLTTRGNHLFHEMNLLA